MLDGPPSLTSGRALNLYHNHDPGAFSGETPLLCPGLYMALAPSGREGLFGTWNEQFHPQKLQLVSQIVEKNDP